MKTNKIKRKTILLTVIILILAFTLIAGIWILTSYAGYISHSVKGELTEELLKKSGIYECDNLMIVAHPDDELLWGGAHLDEGGYFVLCLTNGNNKTRSAEFYEMIQETGSKGIILSYPDKVNGKRSEWKHLNSSLISDLTLIICAKEWNIIATHNPDGEYGHIHHKMTSSLTTSVCIENGLTDDLYYFGKYYKKIDLPDDFDALDPDIVKIKKQRLEVYESQNNTVEKFSHMLSQENWTSFNDYAQ